MASVPWTYDPKPQKEGQSHSRAPHFDGTDYSYWKQRMAVHMKGIDPQMWKLVLNGFTLAEGTTEIPLSTLQIKENDRLEGLDNKAMSIIYCGLNRTEFNRISSCKTSMEIWNRLEICHEGTDEVKETNIRTLTRRLENFKMISGEKIDTFFARFTDLVNPLMALGKEFTQKELVSKALWSLKGTDWKNKRNSIEDGRDFKTLTFEALMGKLKAFEVQSIMEYEEDHPTPSSTEAKAIEKKAIKEEKSIAFKSSKSGKQMKITIDSEDSSEEDIAMLTHTFKKFLKNNKRTTGSPWGNRKRKDEEDTQAVRCYHCDETGHFKANCPKLRYERGKDKEPERRQKHGHKAEWGHSEEEISSSDEETAKPICFMGHNNTAKVKPLPVYSEGMKISDDMFEGIEEAYEFTVDLVADMAKKLKASKRLTESLEDDKEFLSSALSTERKKKRTEQSPKLNEPKEIVTIVDSSSVDKLNCEILDLKNQVGELEKLKIQLSMKLNEQYRGMSLKNAELKISNEKNSILEEKCLNAEKALSTLKGKEKANEASISFSPNIQLEKELNARIEELLLENSKLQSTLKGFTDSSIYMGRMLDGIGNHSQKQGIGFNSNKNVHKKKPTQVFVKPVANVPKHSVVKKDTYFFDEPYTKKKCHFCNCVGHLSFDCYARYFPTKFVWKVKKSNVINTSGINERLSTLASSSAGAGTSSSST